MTDEEMERKSDKNWGYAVYGGLCCQQNEPGNMKQSEETMERTMGLGCGSKALVSVH